MKTANEKCEPHTHYMRGGSVATEEEYREIIFQKEKELQETKERQERHLRDLPVHVRFFKFCKNFIHKADNNLLIFLTLILALATFLVVITR